MNLVTLIRHGQAGTRDDYDRLSDTGRKQAALLGKWFVREQARFDAAVVGGLRRQKETAAIVLGEMERAGLAPARVTEDERWSEFDIDAVFNSLAPRLAAEDAEFRSGLARLSESLKNGEDGVHRSWTPLDTRVVEAWIGGAYETGVESWTQFIGRVTAGLADLPMLANVAVFTSATPAAISVAACFSSREPRRIMHLAGAALNTNLTTLARRSGGVELCSFNQIQHLEERSLRTFR